jgi:predicted ATPase
MTQGQQTLFPDITNDYPTSYIAAPTGALHISKLTIANFKKIEKMEIQLAPFTVLTGVNNSGKSTILQAIWVAFECLRLCVQRETWEIPDAGRALIAFDFLPANEPKDLWYARKYREGNLSKPISIRIDLSNGFFFEANINLYFGAINAKIQDWNKAMDSSAIRDAIGLAPVLIPGHVEIGSHEESRVPAQIHKYALSGQLSLIIRNVLLALCGASYSGDSAQGRYSFDFVAESIRRHFDVSLLKLKFDPERDLELRAPYREEDWELDIVSAGSGLHQILKLAAFIAWRKSRIALLDEPDAHLHTSLQVRLSSFLQDLVSGLGTQIIFATHSRDLISQAPLESVIPVDSKMQKLNPISSIDHLLLEYKRLGAISNMDVALLYQTKRCLFVEGQSDIQLLPVIGAKLGSSAFTGPKQIITFAFKGVNKFSLIKDLADLFQKIIGSHLSWFVLRDRDTATPRVLGHLKFTAQDKGIIQYHIWERYSLENYLLDVNLLSAAVQAVAVAKGTGFPASGEIETLLCKACETVFSETRGSFITSTLDYYHRYDLGTREEATQEALDMLDSASDLSSRLLLLSGSKLFGQFVQELQQKYGLNIRLQEVVAQLNESNVPNELINFIRRLEAMQ